MPQYHDIDISLWRAFVSISETGSIAASAILLYRTPSAISMKIKRLEDIIGAQLFLRHNAGVTLNATGQNLLVHAHRFLKLHDEVWQSIKGVADETVKLGMPDDYAAVFLSEILDGYYKEQPNVFVEVICKTSHELSLLLDSKKVDIAILVQPVYKLGGTVIRKESLHWVGKYGSHPSFSKHVPLVVFPEGCICREIALDTLQRNGKDWRLVFSSHSNAAIYSAIRAGVGVTVSELMLIPEDVSKLDANVALPELPSVNIVVHMSADQPTPATVQLLEHITKTVNSLVVKSVL